jgi:putative spermidine/putrescine transport system ATP-binding protein
MLRPEELSIGDQDENRLHGQVESVTFLGAIIRVRVVVAGQVVTADLFNERLLTLPQVGQTVTVSFPAHACWVV